MSVAAALDLGPDGSVRDARIALGGVAHKPWRDSRAEALLVGRPAGATAFGAAADLLLADARSGAGRTRQTPHQQRFKIALARRAIVRALEMAAAGVVSNTARTAPAGWAVSRYRPAERRHESDGPLPRAIRSAQHVG